MYNIASSAYRNLPMTRKIMDKPKRSFGLLSRNVEATPTDDRNKEARERVAEYVEEIRKEREKLRNG